MKKFLIPLFLVASLAGCGVDGAPQRPAEKAPQTGLISVSGDASIGIRASDL